MKKWEITVIDIKGDTLNENQALSILSEKGWELVNVVSLPLCRRAYLKREIPEEPQKETIEERERDDVFNPNDVPDIDDLLGI